MKATMLIVAMALVLLVDATAGNGQPLTPFTVRVDAEHGHKGERTGQFLGKVTLPSRVAAGRPSAEVVKPHWPTMDFGEYANLKAAADAAAASLPKLGSPLGPASTSTLNVNFPGLDRFGSADQGFIFTPPDVNSAAGILGQIVEVTNNHYACYDTSGNQLQNTPMSVFFGYTTRLLADPRVVYDHIWNRFIVTEVGFAESPTVQFFFVAVSASADCTGPYFVYQFNMPLAAGDFYDYPQTGFDQDALIFTFNVFNNGLFRYAEVDMAPKARAYNGLGFSMPFINGLNGTLTPNLVRDSNGTTVLIRNAPGTTLVQLYNLANTSRSNPSISGPFNVQTNVPCNVPPNASQPGTAATLDTLDSRFQAPGTQIGNFLYQAQTCGIGSFPVPRVVQVDFTANTLTQQDFVFQSATSFDFNPSVAANDFGDVLVNWSSTDPPASQNAAALFSGKLAGASFGPLGLCFQSPTFYTGGRWGDTSGASLNPTDPTQRSWWISNETIEDANNWGTEICSMTVTP